VVHGDQPPRELRQKIEQLCEEQRAALAE